MYTHMGKYLIRWQQLSAFMWSRCSADVQTVNFKKVDLSDFDSSRRPHWVPLLSDDWKKTKHWLFCWV